MHLNSSHYSASPLRNPLWKVITVATKTVILSKTPAYYDVKNMTTQSLKGKSSPYPPLPYKRVIARRSKGTSVAINTVYGLNTNNFPQSYPDMATARARAKLLDQIRGEQSMFLVNLAEMNQTVNTINSLARNTTSKIVKFVANLERAGRTRVRHKIDLSQPWAETWLEMHFGLIPLAQDLQNCVDILSREQVAHVSATSTASWRDDNPIYKGSSSLWLKEGSYGVRISGPVTVSNPNLLLANQLGLLPDAAIAWELVPYSFVVDWFSNVGRYLGQFTELAGISTRYLSTAVKLKSDWTTWTQYGSTAPILNLTMVKGEQFQRSIGIPPVPLYIKPFKGLSVTRGATAMSLLLLQVRRVPDIVNAYRL